jgi:hypothetical protein
MVSRAVAYSAQRVAIIHCTTECVINAEIPVCFRPSAVGNTLPYFDVGRPHAIDSDASLIGPVKRGQ